MDFIDFEQIMNLIGVNAEGLVVNGVSLAALVTWLTSLIKQHTKADPKQIAWALSIIFAVLIGTVGQVPIVAQVLTMLAQAATAWVGATVVYKLGKPSKGSSKS